MYTKSAKLFYTWGLGGEGGGGGGGGGIEEGPEGGVELLSQDYPTVEVAAAGPAAVLLGSLDRADYLPPPPAAAPAPTDVAHLAIGPPENAG